MANRTTNLSLTADTTISEFYPSTNYGTELTITFGSGYRTLGYIRLDSIPRFGEITDATLTLRVSSIDAAAQFSAYIYSICGEQRFTETGATWDTVNGIVEWTEEGVVRTGQVPIAETIINPTDTTVSFDLTMAVYDWHKGRVDNLGFIITADDGTVVCHSRESSNPPQLSVTYRHHETLSQAGKEKWWVTTFLPDGTVIYNDYLEYAPEEINTQQEIPIDEILICDGNKQTVVHWKGSDGESYDYPFSSNTVDQYMFERSTIAREITLSWSVKSQTFANLWIQWCDFGCEVHLYPGRRYDPGTHNGGKAILGLESYNVWTDWPWIDQNQHVRLWKNDVEVYNSLFPGDWFLEANGGRLASNYSSVTGTGKQLPTDRFIYVCRYRMCVKPIEVIPSYSAAHSDRSSKKVTGFQVVCLELDYAERQFGVAVTGGYS